MPRFHFLPLAFATGLALSGCVHRLPEPSPDDIPRLEATVEAEPGNADALTRLGMAYFEAGALQEAEAVLERALNTGRAPGAAYLYLGLTSEERQAWAEAREAYTAYLERGRPSPLKDEIQERLVMIVRRDLQARARDVVAREAELSDRDPTAGTVAVLPFQVTSDDETLEPLRVAVADMMTTDLALSGGLTVLERIRIQALLNEMDLSEAALTTEETGTRTGRLLQAEHVVQGALTSLSEETLRFDTDVVNTERRESLGEASAEDQLRQIFDMEKETVFQILDILGIALTPAEREAINENRAENLMAFLAYGRGLMAMDRGDLDQANLYFREALELDPSFGPAQDAAAEADVLQEVQATSTAAVALRAEPEVMPAPVVAIEPPPELDVPLPGSSTALASLLKSTTEEVVPSPTGLLVDLGTAILGTGEKSQLRDPVQEAAGQEGVGDPITATIRIIIRRPGGED